MNKIIKELIGKLKPSPTLAINEESDKLVKTGKKVYKFGFGQSPFPVPNSVVEALKKNASKNSYLSMQGLKELRSVIAKYLNKNNNNDFIEFLNAIKSYNINQSIISSVVPELTKQYSEILIGCE